MVIRLHSLLGVCSVSIAQGRTRLLSRFQKSASLLAEWQRLLDLAAREVFDRMAGVPLSERCGDEQPAAFEVAAMVGLAGDLCGLLTIRCSRTSAMKLACSMLGVPEQAASPHASDAIGEICNMVAGCFKAKIDGLEDKCMLSIPTVVQGAHFRVRSLAAGESLELSRNFQGEPISFWLQVRL
jgi:chemotaxis protein CheX